MARFRAWIQGRFGNQAFRLGDNGIIAEVTAAKVGVYVVGQVNAQDQDEFDLWATRGRRDEVGDTGKHQYLGRICLGPEGQVTFLVPEEV